LASTNVAGLQKGSQTHDDTVGYIPDNGREIYLHEGLRVIPRPLHHGGICGGWEKWVQQQSFASVPIRLKLS
jgi:hypothetical protein